MKLINDKMIVDLTDSLGLKFMDEKDRNEILMGVLELVGKNAGVRIIEEFTDEETKEFNKIPEIDLEEMENFMIKTNPKARDIFEEEAIKIKETILNSKINA